MRDEDFIRGGIPMTKSEIRAISLSKLSLKMNDTLYDVGAGTGSVSVEAALCMPNGRVFAFEEKEEGCALIEANAKKFGASNITVVPGHAPFTFTDCPIPDCAFIGGSGGSFAEIVDALMEKNPAVRMVANVVTLETLTQALSVFDERSLSAEVVCVNIARAEKTGKYRLMKAQNPVYIITVS